MQTTTTETTTTSNFDAEITAAKAKLEKLQVVATELETEASRWETSFEREPTVQSRDNAQITRQKARNARAAAVAFESDTLKPLEQRARQAERAAISAELAKATDQILSRVLLAGAAIAEAASHFDAAVGALDELHDKRVAAQQRGCVLEPVSLRTMLEALHKDLGMLRGGSYDLSQKNASVELVEQGNKSFIYVTLNRPAPSKSTVR